MSTKVYGEVGGPNVVEQSVDKREVDAADSLVSFTRNGGYNERVTLPYPVRPQGRGPDLGEYGNMGGSIIQNNTTTTSITTASIIRPTEYHQNGHRGNPLQPLQKLLFSQRHEEPSPIFPTPKANDPVTPLSNPKFNSFATFEPKPPSTCCSPVEDGATKTIGRPVTSARPPALAVNHESLPLPALARDSTTTPTTPNRSNSNNSNSNTNININKTSNTSTDASSQMLTSIAPNSPFHGNMVDFGKQSPSTMIAGAALQQLARSGEEALSIAFADSFAGKKVMTMESHSPLESANTTKHPDVKTEAPVGKKGTGKGRKPKAPANGTAAKRSRQSADLDDDGKGDEGTPAEGGGDAMDEGKDQESMDALNEKRLRNTEAARRSRARKVAKMETLEETVQKLETENSQLVVKLAVLESEREGWKAKQIEYLSRIARLEHQLSESHQAIIGRRGTSLGP
ncbi:hypothetical protein HDU97_006268 [Phlyctochytrium planicorne]|nr:hypothetical protein HDU97_006268 [Phlyctochytrium planicorne]